MTNDQPAQPELFAVAELPGRPMLRWHGKRPLREIPYYPAQLRERYGAPPPLAGEGSWVNRLYWGDNLQVMAHLMREFRGQIKLIYIDPPFDSGADYRKRVKLRGTSVQTDLNVLEERQYTDIWSNDLYLQYMYERLILMRELLTEDGSIYLHCDHRQVHHLRCLLEEVFGADRFRNQIAWRRSTPKGNVSRNFGSAYDTILYFAKSENPTWNQQFAEHSPEYIEKYYTQVEKGTGRRYQLTSLLSPATDRPNLTYEFHGHVRVWRYTRERMLELERQERVLVPKEGGMPREKRYLDEMRGVALQDLWTDVHPVNPMAAEREDYPTQKPESLLERIIEASSNPGDLVADFFIGSGTTAAAAQKLGRRWIGADINLGAIHTTAQRLARIVEEQLSTPRQLELAPGQQPASSIQYPVFEVHNVNHYEVFKNAEEARDIVLQLYGVEPLKGHRFFDGTLGSRWVKVIDLNRICSKLDIQAIFDNLPSDDTRGVVVLCAGHEYDVPEAIKQRNLLDVPFEVRDILTDRKDVIFKRPPEAQVSLSREDGQVTLTVEQFYSPLLLQKLSLEDDPEAIEDWRQAVASVLVDPAYDGEVFHPRITDTPARRDDLVRGKYTWAEEEYGEGEVAVKIVDVLDEEWFGVVRREEEGNDGREADNPAPLRARYRREIERVVTVLRERYAPDKIILFGSCSRGDFDEDSDVDLLIVKETGKRPLDRMREVYELVYSPDHYLALDPLVYTPQELAQRLESGDPFIQEIVREGEVLYERE
jgi:adenine-specific DNA-methyltransferase